MSKLSMAIKSQIEQQAAEARVQQLNNILYPVKPEQVFMTARRNGRTYQAMRMMFLEWEREMLTWSLADVREMASANQLHLSLIPMTNKADPVVSSKDIMDFLHLGETEYLVLKHPTYRPKYNDVAPALFD